MRLAFARQIESMPLTHLDLISHWRIAAPVERVWPAVADLRRWPHWWPGIGRVQVLRPEQAGGPGCLCRVHIALRWPLRAAVDIETTPASKEDHLRWRTHGRLEGDVIWLPRIDGKETAITCVWRIEWHGLWAFGLGLLATPLLRWNHRLLMRAGEAGLRRHLAAE